MKQFVASELFLWVLLPILPFFFQEGGFAEEFMLPMIALIIYLMLKYVVNSEDQKIPLRYAIIIGFVSALIMWIKYTLLATTFGAAIFIVAVCIKRKYWAYLFKTMGSFLGGFLIGSLPCLIYFATNNALQDLYEVYFYNLIFVYNGSHNEGAGSFEKALITGETTEYLFLYSILMVLLLLYLFCYKKREKWSAVVSCMLIPTMLIMIYGGMYAIWQQLMLLFPFMPIAIIAIYSAYCKEKMEGFHGLTEFFHVIEKYWSFIFAAIFISSILLFWLGLFQFPAGIIILWVCSEVVYLLCNLLSGKVNKAGARLGVQLCVVAASLCICFVMSFNCFPEYNYLVASGFLALFRVLIHNRNLFKDGCARLLQCIRKVGYFLFRKSFLMNAILTVIAIVACVLLSNNTIYAAAPYADTMQGKMESYIRQKGIKNPCIENLGIIDVGLYNVLGILPETKYYGWYNIELDEVDAEKEQYLGGGIADYVVSVDIEIGNPLLDNYQIVEYFDTRFFPGIHSIIFYERKDLSDSPIEE